MSCVELCGFTQLANKYKTHSLALNLRHWVCQETSVSHEYSDTSRGHVGGMVPPVYEHIVCKLCCKVDSVRFSWLVGYAYINIIDLLSWYAQFTELWISFDNYIVLIVLQDCYCKSASGMLVMPLAPRNLQQNQINAHPSFCSQWSVVQLQWNTAVIQQRERNLRHNHRPKGVYVLT